MPELGGVEQIRDALQQHSFKYEVPEEKFEGDEIASHAAGGKLHGLLEILDVILQQREVDLMDGFDASGFQPLEETLQIPAVGEDGISSHAAFGFEVVDEILEKARRGMNQFPFHGSSGAGDWLSAWGHGGG